MTEPRRTPYPLGTILPPHTVGDLTSTTATTIPAPAAPPTDSEKLDTALGLLELISNRVLELDGKVDRLDAKTDALIRQFVGVRGATEDLRIRVERLEQHEHTHVNGTGGE